MNQDTIWQIIRYGLIAFGGFLTNKGIVSSDQWTAVIGAMTTLFPIAWGVYVKWSTKTVPEATGARMDVPTVSSATGAVQTSFINASTGKVQK